MLSNGRMVLTFVGKKSLDPLARDGFYHCNLLSDALADLVSEVFINHLFNFSYGTNDSIFYLAVVDEHIGAFKQLYY